MPSAVAAQNSQLVVDSQLYQTRCTQCHSIEMAEIPANELLPSQILELVIRMKNMPDSLIQEQEIKPLYRYILFNVYAKKRDLLKLQLEDLSEKEKNLEVQALKQAITAYK
jgi:hypothetical protein